MGSAEITNYMVNGDLTPLASQTRDSVSRLHDIVHRLEEENDYLRPLKQNDRLPTEYSSTNGYVPHDKEEEEEEMCVDSYSLENVPPINDAEFDEVDYEKDDSWLYSPKKPSFPATPVKNADDWLRDKAMTPELLRIRGSLSEKLEVIAIENRKGSYDRLKKSKDDFRKGSTLSLDWDFEAKSNERGYVKKRHDELSSIGGGSIGGSLGHQSRIDEFGSDPDLSRTWGGSDLGAVLPRSVQAWAEDSMPPDDYVPRCSPPDWSDEEEEEEFAPMQINLNNSQCQPRGMKAMNGNMTFTRGRKGQNVAAVRPRTNNDTEQNEFTAKPTGAVKPRRAAPPPQRETEIQYEDERAYSSPSPSYEDSGPVVPRGRLKKDIRTVSPCGYEDPDTAPVILRGTAKRVAAAARRSYSSDDDDEFGTTYDASTFKRVYNAAQQRAPANIVKPVQRRQKPADSTDNNEFVVRPRGSANNNNNPTMVRPRGTAHAGGACSINKTNSPNGVESDPSLKVSLSSSGDGAVVRRRGPVQTAEVAPMPRRSVEPSPRRPKDPVASVRQQEVAPVRRSTGSLPQPRSNDNVARPRRSFSPSGVARPRGAPPM